MGKVRVSKKRQALDGQGQLDLGPADLSPEEVDARIESLAAELSSFKRVRAARIGGIASGRAPRARRYTDEEIMKVFGEELVAQMYGCRLRTAQKLGISGKTVDRARLRTYGH